MNFCAPLTTSYVDEWRTQKNSIEKVLICKCFSLVYVNNKLIQFNSSGNIEEKRAVRWTLRFNRIEFEMKVNNVLTGKTNFVNNECARIFSFAGSFSSSGLFSIHIINTNICIADFALIFWHESESFNPEYYKSFPNYLLFRDLDQSIELTGTILQFNTWSVLIFSHIAFHTETCIANNEFFAAFSPFWILAGALTSGLTTGRLIRAATLTPYS